MTMPGEYNGDGRSLPAISVCTLIVGSALALLAYGKIMSAFEEASVHVDVPPCEACRPAAVETLPLVPLDNEPS